MRILKILFIVLLLIPLAAQPQTKKKSGAAKPKTEQKVDKYPNFDAQKAAEYWKRWIRKEPFTQDDCAGVIELCSVAYDYLNAELEAIIDNNPSETKRRQLAANLQDTDKSGDMNTFVRSFSIRMQELAGNKKLDPALVVKCNEMVKKKKENRRLVDIIFH